MKVFLSFGIPAVLALLLSVPVIPHIWGKEKASSFFMIGLSLLAIAGAILSWIEYSIQDLL